MRTILLTLIALVFASMAHAQDTLRVALVLPGPITDGTFNSAAYEGIQRAEEKYDIEVSIQENTAMAEIESALRSFAEADYDVVIGHGFQFAEPAKKIHSDYPDTWFIVNTARVGGEPNLASFDNRWGDAGYVAGAVAALVSKTGKIGHIGGIPVPVIQEYNEGFKRGAERVNPDIEFFSAYVGSFTDIAKAKEITRSMIERGADVVTATGNENVMGTIQAAQEADVMAIGTAFDSAEMAPDTIVTTALINMNMNIDMAIGKIIDGTIEPRNYLLGFEENGVGLAPYRKFADDLSDEDKARIQQLIEDIRAGRIDDLPEIRR